MSGHTMTITANSDQDTVDNILEMDGDYWTATTNEGITGESTGYELEITLDEENYFGGFSIRNGWSMPTYPVETTFEFFVTGDTTTPSYSFTDDL